jgi:GAF domain-containing protein
MRVGAGASVTAVAARLDALDPDTWAHTARTVQTDSVLSRLCRVVRDGLGVSRATILVFEAPGSLVPAVSVAREDDEELWQRFQTKRPVSLELSAPAAAALRREAVVVVPDAATSPLVPAEWRAAFSLTSLAVAPLHVQDRPWGALVVDDGERRHEFGPHDVRALAEFASLAGAAIAATQRAVAADGETALRAALRDAVAGLTATGDLAEAVDAVEPCLLDASGFELIAAAVHERRLARLLNVGTTSGYDGDALKQLRQGAGEVVASDGRLLVPLRGWHGLLGVLVLRPRRDSGTRLDLVHEVAERLAAVVAQVAAAEREAVAALDAEHAAARLALARQAIGQTVRTFHGAGYGVRRPGPALFSVSSANHARRAIDELDDVRQVLAAQGDSPSFAGALRGLLEPGPAAPYELHWTTSGTPRAVPSGCEIACLRTAARFLGLALESRARILAARVSFTEHGVECLLSSNGLLRDPSAVTGDGTSELLGSFVPDVGGTVEVETAGASFSVRLALPYVQGDRATHDRRPAPARARVR